MYKALPAIVIVLCVTLVSHAERPPQFRNKADAVVTGTVKSIAVKTTKFGGDGVMTTYSAVILVDKVEKSEKIEAGKPLSISWFHVTKRPTRPFPGAYGQNHGLKEKAKARFWLMSEPKGWTIIYNRDGVEKLDK